MNLLQFLYQVDQIISRFSKEKTDAFIHEMARTLPESQRKEFLKKLNAVSDSCRISGTDRLSHDKIQNSEYLRKKILQLEQAFHRIDQGEWCFSSSLNEEYDDWYDSMEEEFFFEDPDGITDLLREGCQTVHQCIDIELYEEGFMLFEQITGLTITINGDYGDFCEPEHNFYEAIQNLCLDIDSKEFVLDGLYAAYHSTPAKQRPKVLFEIICEAGNKKITIEAMMQKGRKDLPEWEEFLDNWTAYLGRQDGYLAESLLKEALELQNNPEKLLETARNCVNTHPEIYEQYLMQGKGIAEQRDKLLAVGKEALASIPLQCTLRSRISLLTAEYALQLNQRETAQNCWLEAFRSDTGIVNYLRLRTESSDFSVYQQKVNQIIQQNKDSLKESYSFSSERLSQNCITKNTYFALTFFQGDFQQVLEKGMKETRALGWSATFMKYGIALFLLYLYSGETLSAGCRAMCSLAVSESHFTKENYEKGLNRQINEESQELFWQCFCRWKLSISLPAEKELQLIQNLEQWISLRVQGIMENNRRNYYNECAAFIAALGEVKESRGEVHGKTGFMISYKTAYPRRRAFHEELRRFGM